MLREVKIEVLDEIQHRWSPRAFSSEPIAQEDIDGVLTAAGLAPSAYNDQPWRFFVATTQEDRDFLCEYMTPGNALWAKNAPVLIVVGAYLMFTDNGLYNYWASFDTGSAWGYMALEANRRGLETHCMGGFDRNDLKRALQLDEHYELYGIIAMGKYGDMEQLSPVQQKAEKPGTRKPIEKFLLKR